MKVTRLQGDGGAEMCAACIADRIGRARGADAPRDILAFVFLMGVGEACSEFTRRRGLVLCRTHAHDLAQICEGLTRRDGTPID